MRFGLHPTFGVEYKEIKAYEGKNLELSYIGWGTFDVPITIYWKKNIGMEESLTIDHYLSFDGEGKWR